MKILSYSKLKSHPNKYLEDHLENVASFSKSSFLSLNFEHNKLYSEIAFLIGLGHDFAKSTSYFQNFLLKDEKTEFKSHSFLSSIFTFYIVDGYLNENGIDFDLNLAVISYIVVLHHHGNLRNVPSLDEYHDNKVSSKLVKNQLNDLINQNDSLELYYKNYNIDLNDFFNNFDDICEKISDNLFDLFDFEYEDFDNYFTVLLFYSVLLDADKMDASESNQIPRESICSLIVDSYKKNHSFNADGINRFREEAYIEVNANIGDLDLSERIYSINLPTGIGKTLTGLSAILKLKDRINNELNINPRIIYSLPFLSVIDQNEDVIRDIFEENNLEGTNYLLKHNYLAEMRYINNNDEEYDISNSKILIEGWNSEFIITTFIQLFYSLIGNKNSYLRKFHNITNSIILLDEVQSIPYKFWGIINLILKKLAYEYNCWVILMTATQPFIFRENEIHSLVENIDYYFNQFDRVYYNFKLEDISLSEFSNELIDVISKNDNKDIMVVLNTVNSSMELYTLLKEYFSDFYEINLDEDGVCLVGDKINLIYLSTNILPIYRLNKINTIKTSDNKQNIVITTQLIEAGVDIDMDIVYRDFAPLDSIIQTAGRCNRSGEKDRGIVNVVSLVNEKGKRYSQFVYEKLLLNTTREVLKSYSIISEKDFNLNASNRYFELISKRSFNDEKLKKILNNLQFEEIPFNFKLIENRTDNIDVFVCINDEAEYIFNRYKYIVENLSGFERKEAFLKIKNKFYQYVISVDEKKFGSVNIYNDEIGVIYFEDLSRKYAVDVGFIAAADEAPIIW